MKILFPKHYSPVMIWTIVVLILTITPGKFVPKVNYWSLLSIDKYVHFSIFFIHTFLALIAFKKNNLVVFKSFLLIALIGILFGMLIEYIQIFIPERSFEWNDMIANMIGSLGALLVAFFIFRSSNNQ